ncbi:hypothetical protein [Corallococcus carmarthensis]|uniref:hypothetical protein n=1 Tax=Corallococcus carmarthensis TaxID=2316728 RepID=UPI00148CE109|nr:hypothetical protein [Corallococcus carmarthensis]NOK19990.1 hypothetical protein [Corallococcus carmarthensis]
MEQRGKVAPRSDAARGAARRQPPRLSTGFKGRHVAEFQALLAKHLPYCRVRYAF